MPAVTEITLDIVEPTSDDALASVAAYFAELDERFPQGFDGAVGAESAGADGYRAPQGAFVIARLEGRAVGCGALQSIGEGVGEIKRMWVDRSMRGRGVGRRLLAELERLGREAGHHTLRLDTNEHLPEAIALYGSCGYVEIDRYNDNPYPTHFFEKRLG